MLALQPFTVSVSDAQIKSLRDQLALASVAPRTYASLARSAAEVTSTVKDESRGTYGVSGDWIESTSAYWQDGFDWSEQEERINSFKQFTAEVPSGAGSTMRVHFVYERSRHADACPLLLMHGWPGSFLEFLPLAALLRDTQHFHLIIPSLPGYLYSDAPALDESGANFGFEKLADVMHNLMTGLGHGEGYVCQGGDIGSFLARLLAVRQPQAVQAVHLNMCPTGPPKSHLHAMLPNFTHSSLLGRLLGFVAGFLTPLISLLLGPPATFLATKTELRELPRFAEFGKTGSAYGQVHATRPATIAEAVCSSPRALLAWVGEKYLEWSDEPPSRDEMLAALTLWHLTSTFATSIYPYRSLMGVDQKLLVPRPADPTMYIAQPTGYAWLPREIMPVPQTWVAQTCNLRFWREYKTGGHFAAWEKPVELANDLVDFFVPLWRRGASSTAASKKTE